MNEHKPRARQPNSPPHRTMQNGGALTSQSRLLDSCAERKQQKTKGFQGKSINGIIKAVPRQVCPIFLICLRVRPCRLGLSASGHGGHGPHGPRARWQRGGPVHALDRATRPPKYFLRERCECPTRLVRDAAQLAARRRRACRDIPLLSFHPRGAS